MEDNKEVKPILIFEKMALVMGEVAAIPKNKTGAGLNYKFRGIDDFMNALNPLMAKHKVVFSFEIIKAEKESYDQESNFNNQKKIVKWTNALLTIKYTFYTTDGSWISCTTIGEGKDNSDKAHNKAMSAALKYALMQMFLVPTEDLIDQDSERPGDEKPAINPPAQQLVQKAQELKNHAPQGAGPSEAQIKRLYAICKKSNWTEMDLKSYMDMRMKLKSVSQLNTTKYNELCTYIDQNPLELTEIKNEPN